METGFLSSLWKELLFTVYKDNGSSEVREKVREDNRKFVIIWASLQIVYWGICLTFSFRDIAFERCRNAYLTAIFICAAALFIALLVAKKDPELVLPAAITVEAALLGAGIWIAGIQLFYSARTVVMFAAVLIVPVMFITDTIWTLSLLLINIITCILFLKNSVPEEPYSWALSNLVIFSSVGILIGHFVNKARYERYVFADDAAKLADLQRWNATHDQMTGLKNRRSYSDAVEELQKHLPENFCAVMADINGLKFANDTLGHDAGDELICGAAECLRKAFEDIGEIYRVGGDEFCILASGSKEEIEKRIQKVEELSAAWDGEQIHEISISCGAAFKEESDLDGILKAADEKMYESKNQYYETTRKKRREI